MHSLESILTIILFLFLLTPVITVSEYLKSRFELLSDANEDLKIEVGVLSICCQEDNINNMLEKLVEYLNCEGVNWVSIELYTDRRGKLLLRILRTNQ